MMRPGRRPNGAPAPPPIAWHALAAEEVARRLDGGSGGLSSAEAARRLAALGPNRLPGGQGKSALRRLLGQFDNLLIYVLLAAAAVSLGLGHAVDAAVILAVVVANAAIGFIQEGRAESALDAIRGMLAPKASVLRDGRRVTIDAQAIVPGDLVLVEAGDRVAADLRLVRGRNLQIQEAALTGESLPAEKSSAACALDAPLGDRAGMAYSGTMVTAGRGEGIAVATGLATELGRISALLAAVEPLTTPLLRQMNRFSRQLTVVILAVAAVVFGVGAVLRGGSPGETFMAMVGMAVAAIPEGLPAVLTITLAIGVRRMAGRNAIIRRLPAVETLGSVSVICSDKTGTLTRNELTVRAVVTADCDFEATGVGYEPHGALWQGGVEVEASAHRALFELLRAAALCNDAALRPGEGGWIVDGDPMEGALLSLAVKGGLEPERLRKEFPRLDEIPFDAQHRFMATLHRDHAGPPLLYVKGAPERVLAMCDRAAATAGEQPLDSANWHRRVEALASAGQRVIAVAFRRMPDGRTGLDFADLDGGLVFLGVLGLIDPPREDAIAAVRECRQAGIRVKMITGDHAATARAVAAQLGLENAGVVATGHTLDAADDAALLALARDCDVFARTSPEQKLRLVRALQADGAVVAMTGDGANDSPALKQADVGIAMGHKGTEAAKDAAEMILADDNFASIVAAVREGRSVYDNLTKVIAWTLPTNVGEALCMVAAVLIGLPLPMTPVQILWINTVTTVSLGLVLAFEPAEPDVMRKRPRRPGEPILSGFLLWRVLSVSAAFAITAFGVFAWGEAAGLAVETVRTLVVNTIVVLELFYLFSVRYLRLAALTWRGLVGTRAVWIGVGLIVAAQFAFTYAPPLQALFDTRPVAFADGLVVVAIGVLFFALFELEKWALRLLTGRAAN